jgi:hypothetical protein
VTKPLEIQRGRYTIRFVDADDEYSFNGENKKYGRTKITWSVAGKGGWTEVPKEVFECVIEALLDEPIKERMKRWG